jgi:hypothetical protein
MSNRTSITIRTDNDAFQGAAAFELARVLRKLADTIEADPAPIIGVSHTLRDRNGNTCGKCIIQHEDN